MRISFPSIALSYLRGPPVSWIIALKSVFFLQKTVLLLAQQKCSCTNKCISSAFVATPVKWLIASSVQTRLEVDIDMARFNEIQLITS